MIVALQITSNNELFDNLNSLEYQTLGRKEKKWREFMMAMNEKCHVGGGLFIGFLVTLKRDVS